MKTTVPSEAAAADDRKALMSALADGDAQALHPACDLWRDDAEARATWHRYHLIGDVLRSDDLANAPARDAAFLVALRTRLATEPALPAPARAATRRPWLVPAAMAASFVAVAGLVLVMREVTSAGDGPVLAVGPAAQSNLTLAGTAASAARPLVIEGRLIRDPRLDAYLRAHREARGGAPYAVPGGVPRNVEAHAPAAVATAPVTR